MKLDNKQQILIVLLIFTFFLLVRPAPRHVMRVYHINRSEAGRSLWAKVTLDKIQALKQKQDIAQTVFDHMKSTGFLEELHGKSATSVILSILRYMYDGAENVVGAVWHQMTWGHLLQIVAIIFLMVLTYGAITAGGDAAHMVNMARNTLDSISGAFDNSLDMMQSVFESMGAFVVNLFDDFDLSWFTPTDIANDAITSPAVASAGEIITVEGGQLAASGAQALASAVTSDTGSAVIGGAAELLHVEELREPVTALTDSFGDTIVNWFESATGW